MKAITLIVECTTDALKTAGILACLYNRRGDWIWDASRGDWISDGELQTSKDPCIWKALVLELVLETSPMYPTKMDRIADDRLFDIGCGASNR